MSRDPMQQWCSRPDKRVTPEPQAAAEPPSPVDHACATIVQSSREIRAMGKRDADPVPPEWISIATPPEAVDSSSVRVLGWCPRYGHVFAQYTPFYLGRPDESEMLWICEGFGVATKPTHWLPLHQPVTSEGSPDAIVHPPLKRL